MPKIVPGYSHCLEHLSHRYTLADDGEEQLSLMESCHCFCTPAYICARNTLGNLCTSIRCPIQARFWLEWGTSQLDWGQFICSITLQLHSSWQCHEYLCRGFPGLTTRCSRIHSRNFIGGRILNAERDQMSLPLRIQTLLCTLVCLVVARPYLHPIGGIGKFILLSVLAFLLMFVVTRSGDIYWTVIASLRAITLFLFALVTKLEIAWRPLTELIDLEEPGLLFRFQRPPPASATQSLN
jgi:hypothetical protein